VTGSKDLAGASSSATCSAFDGGTFVSARNIVANYTATINGVQRSAGPATVSVDGVLGVGPPGFSERFASTGLDQLTSKGQCKNVGWRGFGFKNQGDCVSFVATGGRTRR